MAKHYPECVVITRFLAFLNVYKSRKCSHPINSEYREQVIRGGSKRLVTQCLICGKATSQPMARNKIDYIPAPFDEDLWEMWNAETVRQEAVLSKGYEEEFGEWRHNRKEWYSLYLLTDHWVSLRGEIFVRDKYTCRRCGNAADEVHHISYEDLGNEDPDDLISLCRNCHYEEHFE